MKICEHSKINKFDKLLYPIFERLFMHWLYNHATECADVFYGLAGHRRERDRVNIGCPYAYGFPTEEVVEQKDEVTN